ncbi:4-hydroxy-3-methylbut-2-enyl diphosphatesynthase [Striga asiatica]|uniref:4-hydroxy-3-methylbut-2-enyl diphosphatesynthase n=1 Tax=Striga asiatica TaxID=4170 RepID=A0A5A7P5T4_STRAF|nr:4-hydroxy-3-methylbut-2-enyl diphosphatesynthase [Striga asiatica]
MGVISPLSKQLAMPLPNALVLVALNELSTYSEVYSGTRMVVYVRGDKPHKELKVLKTSDAIMILHKVPYTEENVSRIHTARRIQWLQAVFVWIMPWIFRHLNLD